MNRLSLYLFTLEGCPACAKALPEFDKFVANHPMILALKFDADGPYPEHFGIQIKATPAYVIRRGDDLIVKSGMMTTKQLETWVKNVENTAR